MERVGIWVSKGGCGGVQPCRDLRFGDGGDWKLFVKFYYGTSISCSSSMTYTGTRGGENDVWMRLRGPLASALREKFLAKSVILLLESEKVATSRLKDEYWNVVEADCFDGWFMFTKQRN